MKDRLVGLIVVGVFAILGLVAGMILFPKSLAAIVFTTLAACVGAMIVRLSSSSNRSLKLIENKKSTKQEMARLINPLGLSFLVVGPLMGGCFCYFLEKEPIGTEFFFVRMAMGFLVAIPCYFASLVLAD